jgi:hypothetical protein
MHSSPFESSYIEKQKLKRDKSFEFSQPFKTIKVLMEMVSHKAEDEVMVQDSLGG